MNEQDRAEERFQAWAAQQAREPQPRKYDRPGRWESRISTTVAVVVSVLF